MTKNQILCRDIKSKKLKLSTVKSIILNYYSAGKNTKVGTPTLPEAMERAVGLMAPDRHVANRVIILVSAVYRSTDIQSVKGRVFEIVCYVIPLRNCLQKISLL